jgi:uncharacterized lipoprotein NlpE involved in copper resistance
MDMKITYLISIVAIILLIVGCNNSSNPTGYNMSPTTPPPPTPNTISIKSFAFSPAVDTISLGTTITWKNNDGVAHTSTSNNGSWDTGSIPAGGSKTTVFNAVGSFPYHCTIHPSMTGIIVVK